MIPKASRFVGYAVAFVAGTLASSPLASAQVTTARASGDTPDVLGVMFRSAVSGVVRDRTGHPQIGVLVELLNTQYGVIAHTFTDDRGRYSLPRLGAGVYQVQASNALFLPAMRPDLRLFANTKAVVNLTLSNLYQALDWLPTQPRDASSADDDWNWTLRLSTNRPLLRVLETNTAQCSSEDTEPGRVLSASDSRSTAVHGPVPVETGHADKAYRVMLRSGFARFGEGGFQQQIGWSADTGEGRAVLLQAGTATEPDGLGRLSTTAAYRQELSPDRSMTTIVTLSDRPSIHSGMSNGLVTMHLRSASTVRLGDFAKLSAGTELEAARLGNGSPALGSHPFATFTVHAGSTEVRYRMSSTLTMTGADTLEQQAAEDAPAFVEQDGRLRMEAGLHQELRVSRQMRSWAGDRAGALTGELSLFDDTLAHPVVEGVLPGKNSGDEATVDSDNVLYDPGTGTIAVSGQGYRHGGVMALLHDQLSPDTWLSFRYAMGDAVSMPETTSNKAPHQGSFAQNLPSFTAKPASMAAVAAGTRLPIIGTAIRGSYRWQPLGTLTEVAPFESGMPDAYLGFSLRQPLHLQRVGTGKLEAILDVRNLLAQGYRPFLSTDGTMVYFAQAQRCIAGGISFSF